jgi:hypothetical protein
MGVVFEADTFSLVQIAYIKAFQQIKYMDNGISYLIVLLLNTVINIRFFGGMPGKWSGGEMLSGGKVEGWKSVTNGMSGVIFVIAVYMFTKISKTKRTHGSAWGSPRPQRREGLGVRVTDINMR